MPSRGSKKTPRQKQFSFSDDDFPALPGQGTQPTTATSDKQLPGIQEGIAIESADEVHDQTLVEESFIESGNIVTQGDDGPQDGQESPQPGLVRGQVDFHEHVTSPTYNTPPSPSTAASPQFVGHLSITLATVDQAVSHLTDIQRGFQKPMPIFEASVRDHRNRRFFEVWNDLKRQQGPNPFGELEIWKRQNFRTLDVDFAINIIRDFVRSEFTTNALIHEQMSKQGWPESCSELLAEMLYDPTAVKDAFAALCLRLQTRYRGAAAVLPLLQALFDEYADLHFQHTKLTAEKDY